MKNMVGVLRGWFQALEDLPEGQSVGHPQYKASPPHVFWKSLELLLYLHVPSCPPQSGTYERCPHPHSSSW